MACRAQDEDVSMSLPELARTPWGAASLACEALALAGMTPFLYIEATTLREYGLHGWLSAWNVMDVIAYAVQAQPPPTLPLAENCTGKRRGCGAPASLQHDQQATSP